MRQLWLTAGVVLVVLFFEGGQASVVAVNPVNQSVNTTAGLFEVVPVNAVPNTVSVEPKSMCCVTGLDRNDYIVTPGVGAHKFFKQAMTWNVARDICVRDGAQLAVINSDAEEALFRSWKSKNSIGGVWIGVHDLFQQDWWVTLLGEPLATMSYDIWANNRPDNAFNREHCGVIWDDPAKGIDDCPCDRKYAFVCEINVC
ncbi:hemolymph lipopolysaccharide-binding protein-like isoform X13 [Halictus rubicundus]|uniref:hemolymph lipopolysaccharide-binding protein-like isoform X13 n=1 Tax=Halictus rubicundus TaxID=77578 RepID=UPI0040359A91